jgi:hypothetical protein
MRDVALVKFEKKEKKFLLSEIRTKNIRKQ